LCFVVVVARLRFFVRHTSETYVPATIVALLETGPHCVRLRCDGSKTAMEYTKSKRSLPTAVLE
jgi:hypothetical protein